MDSDREREAWSFVTGLILGGVIGASVAMLTAPQPGRKTRRRIRRSARQLRGSTSTRFDQLADELRGRVDEAIHAARDHLG
jgi:gas vesicle protein